MARHDAFTLDREHVTGSFLTDHELGLTGINRTDDPRGAVKGD
jgi:hypothetical protein